MGSPEQRCTPVRAYQWMMEVDRKARIRNQERLHSLSLDRSKGVLLFCSHDAIEFEEFAPPAKRTT